MYYDKPWRTVWSDQPCVRDYYGKNNTSIPTDEVAQWRNIVLYMVASSAYWRGGTVTEQMAHEYCSHDYISGAELTLGDRGNGMKWYIKANLTAQQEATAAVFWNKIKDYRMREMINATHAYNVIYHAAYGVKNKLHPTDPTSYVPS